MIIGIDYGAKLAGTTAICFGESPDSLNLIQSTKNVDADKFILDFLTEHNPLLIGLDAPLGLPPGVLGQGDNYFYRPCDTALGAMSPMFIGGLTARAMKIKNDIQGLYHCEVIEVYPKAVTHKLLDENFKSLYKQKGQGTIENFAVLLYELHQIKTSNNPTNWHQLDAVLAWYSTYRYHIRQHLSFGDASGMIIV